MSRALLLSLLLTSLAGAPALAKDEQKKTKAEAPKKKKEAPASRPKTGAARPSRSGASATSQRICSTRT